MRELKPWILCPKHPEALVVPKTVVTKSSKKKPVLTKAQENAAIKRVLAVMAIPGKSGNELGVANFIRNELLAAGAEPSHIVTDTAHKKTPIKGNTGNLIYHMPGTVKAPRRMLMAHMDTVPICVGSKPKRNGKMVRSADKKTGLGADDRAGVATTLTAATEILRRDLPRPPLTFLWTVQEEIGLHGARLLNLAKLKKPQMAFNWDGGAPHKLTIGATGGYRMEINIHGKASHAGNAPAAGVSAIAIAALAIADLHENGWHGHIQKGKKLGTSNVGVIEGGAATNVVTDLVTLRAEARSHDSAFRKKIVAEIEKAFVRAAKKVRSTDGDVGSIEFDGRLDYESFALPTNSPGVKVAQAAVAEFGLEPQLAIANGGLDANWLSARGIPTVSLGCGQKNQHMVTEALDLDEYCTACRIALFLATAGGL